MGTQGQEQGKGRNFCIDLVHISGATLKEVLKHSVCLNFTFKV